MLFFAYGANMTVSAMTKRCPEHLVPGAAQPPSYRRGFMRRSLRWDAGVLDIVPAPGDVVCGALYEVSMDEMRALDEAEGLRFAYRRREVEVFLRGERLVAATHELIERELNDVQPADAYLELLWAGARERGLSLDDT